MSLIWTDDLSTGVTALDNHQKELLVRITALFDACGEGKGRYELGRFHGFLQDYVTTHLYAEERCMTMHGYEGLSLHRAEHEVFKAEVAALGKMMRSAGANSAVIIHALRITVEWAASHVHRSDRDMAEFLRSRTAAGILETAACCAN